MVVLVLGLAAAWACEPLPCDGGWVVPADGATVPANLPAFGWIAREGSSGGRPVAPAIATPAGGLPLEDVVGDELRWIRPSEALPVGAPVTLSVPVRCSWDGQPDRNRAHHRVTVAAPAAVPSALGTVVVEPLPPAPVEVSSAMGSCSATVPAARARVRVALDDSAAPWADALLFETLVDGEVWRPAASLSDEVPLGGSWEGRGVDLLFAACRDGEHVDVSLDEGTHRVRFRARLPGGEVWWETPEVPVTLTCPAASAPSGGSAWGCRTAPLGPWWVAVLAVALRRPTSSSCAGTSASPGTG